MKLAYFKNLDGIRGIAALMVMVFHFSSSIESGAFLVAILKKIAVFGQTGVTLFFVLSGFLITRILLFTKSDPHYFKSFYIRRTLRIFPLYYFFLLLFYYVLPPVEEGGVHRGQLYYFIYLQNFAMTFNWASYGPVHFWSLAVEEHFYLFWPLVVYFLDLKNLVRLILFIVVGALGLRVYMLSWHYDVFYFTFTRFDSLAIGALLSILEVNETFKGKRSWFLAIIAAVFIPTIIMWSYFTGESNITIQVFKYVLISVIYFGIIGFILCLKRGAIVNRILESDILSYTGKISYGLYVYHPVAFALALKYFDARLWTINLLIGFSLAYLISSASYYLIELRFLDLKRRFEYKKIL
jgi:peptidoglycan/LPS O-acetylase OafA/YrhL